MDSLIVRPNIFLITSREAAPTADRMELQMNSMLRFALFLLLSAPTQARDNHGIDARDLEFGPVLVCDTQEQVERYIALYQGDQDAAVRAVNQEQSDPRACGVVNASFVKGPHIAAASRANMAFEILRILVVGIDGPFGLRPVNPAAYFTALGVTEYQV
jgi:hypothetical protein